MGSSSSFRSSFGSEFGGEKASSSYSSSSSSGGCSRRDSNGSFIDDAMQDVSSSSYNETHIATDLRFGSWTSILFGRLSWMPPCVAAGRGRRLGKPRPPDAPTSLCHGDHHLSPYVKCGIRAHAHAHGGEGISNTSSLRNYGGVEKKKKKKKKRNVMMMLGGYGCGRNGGGECQVKSEMMMMMTTRTRGKTKKKRTMSSSCRMSQQPHHPHYHHHLSQQISHHHHHMHNMAAAPHEAAHLLGGRMSRPHLRDHRHCPPKYNTSLTVSTSTIHDLHSSLQSAIAHCKQSNIQHS